MPPHTDGTGQARPPELVGLVCAKPADSGGEALLVDGLTVVEELLATDEATVRALAVPGSVRFGESDKRYAVLNRWDDKNRYYLRYRADGLADFGDVADHITRLQHCIKHHTRVIRLSRGDGYVLQNGRWLHGRTAFTGSREMLRLIGRPTYLGRLPNVRFGFTVPYNLAAT
jgi:alpha-ketoglutarate-dependent taurine dioxygenase